MGGEEVGIWRRYGEEEAGKVWGGGSRELWGGGNREGMGRRREYGKSLCSSFQRMSVLVRCLSRDDPKQMTVYVKGAPEKISQLCQQETGRCLYLHYV